MIEPKVSLSFLVPGATMLSPQECGKNPQNYDTFRLTVENKKGKKDTLVVHTRKSRLVTHHINIGKEAYEYMMEVPTEPKLKKIWHTLPKTDRLKHHFDMIGKDLRAVSYSYEILQD